jgi:hypothetical protein
MTDLNAFVPPGSGLTLVNAGFINDRGEIAGLGMLPDGNTHVVLLAPCGEGTDGCVDVVEGTVAASHAPAVAAAQRQLTPQEVSRIRVLLMKRHRGFMQRTMH